MGRIIFASAASGSLALAAALAPAGVRAQNDGEILLEPSSAWNATYDEGRCRLSRMFGAVDGQHALVFEQSAPGSSFNMSVAGPATSAINGGLNLQLAFGPGGPATDQVIVKERNPEFGSVLFLKDIDLKARAAPEADAGANVGFSAASDAIDVTAAGPLRSISLAQGRQTLVFKTGPLAAPFGVLNDCTAHILSTWGIDPEAHRTAQRKAKMLEEMKVARVIQRQYPLRAVREGRGGVVGLAILVDPSGKPTECKITNDSGDRNLNEVACEGLMQARFDPALDASGKPIPSYWQTRVTYRIAI
jgi:TonB family protein